MFSVQKNVYTIQLASDFKALIYGLTSKKKMIKPKICQTFNEVIFNATTFPHFKDKF